MAASSTRASGGRCGRLIALVAALACAPATAGYPAGSWVIDRAPGPPRDGGCSVVAELAPARFRVVCSLAGGHPVATSLALDDGAGPAVELAEELMVAGVQLLGHELGPAGFVHVDGLLDLLAPLRGDRE